MTRNATTIPQTANVDDVTLTTENGTIKIKDAGVGTTQLADLSVTTAKINDSAITVAKLSDVAKAIQIDEGSYLTESTSNSASFTNHKTFTFTPTSSNNIVLAIYCKADIKKDGGGNAAQMRMSYSLQDATGSTTTIYSDSVDGQTGTTYSTHEIWWTPINSTLPSGFIGGKSSYSINVERWLNNAGSGIKNVYIRIYYIDNGTLTTSSAKIV